MRRKRVSVPKEDDCVFHGADIEGIGVDLPVKVYAEKGLGNGFRYFILPEERDIAA
jgi:hypothetical protein